MSQHLIEQFPADAEVCAGNLILNRVVMARLHDGEVYLTAEGKDYLKNVVDVEVVEQTAAPEAPVDPAPETTDTPARRRRRVVVAADGSGETVDPADLDALLNPTGT